MILPEEKIAELFEFLDRLGELGPDELLVHFTSGNIEALRLLSGLLKAGMDLERILSEKRFINIVKELFETKKIWSERLLETLALAARENDQGNRIQALWILNGFIRFCPSPYYRELAEKVKGEYEKISKP